MLPLKKYNPPHEQGVFGAVRKHDIHTGIDLYCEPGEEVLAIEDGEVVDFGFFTGPDTDPPMPWWNSTEYIVVLGKSGYILYGEIKIEAGVKTYVSEGDVLGRVQTVLKKDKGLPMTMLHLELYSQYTKWVEWALNTSKPEGLEDPTGLIK